MTASIRLPEEITNELRFKYIDCSGFSCFRRCPVRFLFERLLGLKQAGDLSLVNIAPDYGTCIHRALPFAYTDPVAALEEFKKAWSNYHYEGEDVKRNILRAESMLNNFHRLRSKNCPYTILSFPGIKYEAAETISPNEVPFTVDVGATVPFAGRIDAPIRLVATGYLIALDYKTASEISGRFFDCFTLSPQAVGYSAALSLLTNEDVFGFGIEALRVSPTNDEVQIGLIPVSNEAIDSFIVQLQDVSARISDCMACNSWPKNFAGCSPYASHGHPGRLCEYHLLCNQPNWLDALPNYIRTNPFDPFVVSHPSE